MCSFNELKIGMATLENELNSYANNRDYQFNTLDLTNVTAPIVEKLLRHCSWKL